MREEKEIALETLNGSTFRRTINPMEAMHEIYGKCLGFSDLDNFDGVRVGYRGDPVIVIKLKAAKDVDQLLPVQHFDYLRKSSRNGKMHSDVISCKIRGLRSHQDYPQRADLNKTAGGSIDDGSRFITIEGCEYRVPKEVLKNYLSNYVEVMSDILEVICNDGATGIRIRTGSYSVKVKLTRDLPQWAPLVGRRVKFFYKGIQKLCPICFGPNSKKKCQSQKVQWIEYVEAFIEREKDITADCFWQVVGNPG
jgi:hypothetical protein